MKSKVKKPAGIFRRSILLKYLTVSLSIILVCMIAMGIAMLFFVANYWEEEKKANLVENAEQVVDMIYKVARFDHKNRQILVQEEDYFKITISTIAKSTDATILIADNKGNILYSSETNSSESVVKAIPSYILSDTALDVYFDSKTLGGYYDTTHYTAGVPIRTKDTKAEIVAYCYVSTKSSFVSGLVMATMRTFLAAAITTMLLSLVFIYVLSYHLSQPLRQMSNAAKKFAVGDFSARVNVSSQDEVGELALAFNHMADSLTASEGMRRSFIANVSHELKTPMTTIAGFVDGMLDGTIPPERHRHYMNIVSLEVKRLSRLVQSMLALSRIDNGELKLNCREFEMFSVIVNVLAGFEQKISEKNIEIKGLEDFVSLKVNADPDLMHQVVYNLIENAVKFTNENGYISFSAIETKYDITVAIENSGPGIPPEDIRYIFDRFYKTDKSRSVDKKGMGLGLFITKSIMRLHSGYIFVESEPEKYTRFTFKLPLIAKQAPKPDSEKYIDTTANTKTEE